MSTKPCSHTCVHILVLAMWQEEAFEEEEKYKEGKYIIEKAKMTQENW